MNLRALLMQQDGGQQEERSSSVVILFMRPLSDHEQDSDTLRPAKELSPGDRLERLQVVVPTPAGGRSMLHVGRLGIIGSTGRLL